MQEDILFYEDGSWCFRDEAERNEYEGRRLDNAVSVLRTDSPAYEAFMCTIALDSLAIFSENRA
jgi:hypothetical protein